LQTNRYIHIDDNQLLENFYADRNNEWLGILLQRYTLLLFGVCMKYMKQEDEAKDCVQQVFLKAITELSKYKVDYFKSWIYMVAKNHCLMKLRDRNKQWTEISDQHLSTPDEPNAQQQAIEKEQHLNKVEMALQQLNKEQQHCITLFYLEKRSYQEITETTGYTLLQVKSYIQNGKRNLRIYLEQQHEQ
jgi:RNA polymerase sigma-70 factor (ECF subfamily)